ISAKNTREADFIRKLRNRDQDAWLLLFEQHKFWVTKTCHSIIHDSTIAEDISEEGFIRIFQSIDKFQGSSSLKTWMYSIIRNLCSSFLTKNTEIVFSIDDFAETMPAREATVDHRIADRQILTIVQTAIQELDPLTREALLLRTCGG